MTETLHFKDTRLERRVFAARAVVIFLISLALVLALLARLVQLQVVEHHSYATRAEENRIQVQPLPPDRGLIYDRNGVLLADNRPVRSLALVVELVPDLDALIDALRERVDLDDADIAQFHRRVRHRRPHEPVALKLNLSEAEVARVRVDGHRWPGARITDENLRHYPFAELTAHALGSVRRVTAEDTERLDAQRYRGVKFVGRLGVEKFYEDVLHGHVGWQRVEVDARGRVRRVMDATPPVAGQNLTLHLDSALQSAAAAALEGRRGAVVALDTRSGGVLALVSNPGYDANLFVVGVDPAHYQELVASRDTPLFNRAISGRYAPGSTFKPIVALAGLSVGATDWERVINDRGEFRLPGRGRVYRDWSWRRGNAGGQGIVNLRKAIYRSSNVYFYDLATRMDVDVLSDFAGQFGYGRVTSIDIAGADPGLLPSRVWKQGARGEPWYAGDSVNLGIGQGDLLATPLQLATAAMVIANRGQWIRPRMLLSSDGTVPGFPTTAPARVHGPTEAHWEGIVDAMEDVVHRGHKGFRENGTAWFHIGRDIGYRMAGKSGTAQVVGIAQGEEYDDAELDEYQRKHAWFIAFAPADAPAIAVSVLVENGGGGSSVAAPVAKSVIDAWLLPRLAKLEAQAAEAGATPEPAPPAAAQPASATTLAAAPAGHAVRAPAAPAATAHPVRGTPTLEVAQARVTDGVGLGATEEPGA